jgi:hypothetical protein
VQIATRAVIDAAVSAAAARRGTAAAGAIAAAFLAGAGLSFVNQAERAALSLSRDEAARAADPTIARARANAATLAVFRAQGLDHDALSVAARGLSLLHGLDATPRAWSVRKGVFEAEWSLDGAAAPPNTIAAAFEADPMFSGVAPKVDGEARVATLSADVMRQQRKEKRQ